MTYYRRKGGNMSIHDDYTEVVRQGPKGPVRIYRYNVCRECGRRFDMLSDDDAAEWFYGHDCEA